MVLTTIGYEIANSGYHIAMPVRCAFDLRFQNYGLASQLLTGAGESIIEDSRMGGIRMVRLVSGSIKEIKEGYGGGKGLGPQER